MKTPLVSIVIPVYNVEKYLEECVDSIVSQDIGFTENIELILVNDGSKDKSGAICKNYLEKYPDNVVYIEQKNAGASEARNTGLRAAQGTFVGFIDADDYISKDVVGAVMSFFKTAPSDVNAAITRVVQFGTKNRERPINKKFDQGTRVVDLNHPEWFDICPRIAPAFIRTSVAQKHYFHKDIRFYEDTRYFNEVVAETMKLGVVAKGVYFNRKHDETDKGASITTGATNEKRFYLDSPEKVSLYLLEKMAGQHEYPPLYFQYLAQYEIRWRTFYNQNTPREVLSPAEYEQYMEINKKILSYISDEAIVGFKLHNVWQRVYLLNLKHGIDVLEEASFNQKNKLTWQGHVIFNHMKKMQTRVTDLRIDDNRLVLEGYFTDFIVKGVKVDLRVDGVPCDNMILSPDSLAVTDTPLEHSAYKRTTFEAYVPLNKHKACYIDFMVTIEGEEYTVSRLNLYPMFEPDTATLPRYIKVGDYTIARRHEGLSILPPHNIFYHRVKFEIGRVKRYLVKLYKGIGR